MILFRHGGYACVTNVRRDTIGRLKLITSVHVGWPDTGTPGARVQSIASKASMFTPRKFLTCAPKSHHVLKQSKKVFTLVPQLTHTSMQNSTYVSALFSFMSLKEKPRRTTLKHSVSWRCTVVVSKPTMWGGMVDFVCKSLTTLCVIRNSEESSSILSQASNVNGFYLAGRSQRLPPEYFEGAEPRWGGVNISCRKNLQLSIDCLRNPSVRSLPRSIIRVLIQAI